MAKVKITFQSDDDDALDTIQGVVETHLLMEYGKKAVNAKGKVVEVELEDEGEDEENEDE